MEMVSIPKKEYQRLKKMEMGTKKREENAEESLKEDLASLKRSLEDAKAGRIRRF